MTVLQGRALEVGEDGHSAGRALLAQLYEAYAHKPMPTIAVGQWGKPYFLRSSVYFSISHSKEHVFCALSHRPIGIDAEETDRKIDLRLADKILSDSEKLRWEQAADKSKALLRLWVLKEAAAKCAGTGLQGYPKNTDFDPDDPRVTEQNGCFVAVIEEETHAV